MGKNRNNSSSQKGHAKSKYQQPVAKASSSSTKPMNNKARECDERRLFLRNKIEIKRLVTNMQKQKAIAVGEALPPALEEERRKKNEKKGKIISLLPCLIFISFLTFQMICIS